MYIYFDTNGTIKEIVNDKSIRQGSTEANKIYCYIEGNPTIDDIWYMQKLPSGETSNEVSFKNSTVTKAIPYDAKRDMKYFKDFEQYTFYVFTLNAWLVSQKGLNLATIRIVVDNEIFALGELTFNVQENVINVDNGITISQYDYLLLAYASRTLNEVTGQDLDTLLDDKINAKIGDLANGSPKVFDTEANIEAMHSNEGIAVATDTGYIYVWNDTQQQYISTGMKYIADVSLFYTKTESDNTFAPKSTAITHTGNQLQDYSGNNIYPNLDDGQVTYANLDDDLKKQDAIKVSYLDKSSCEIITGWTNPSQKYIITQNVSIIDINNPAASISADDFQYTIVECSEGEKFIINGYDGNNMRCWCFTDASYNKLSSSMYNTGNQTHRYAIAPTNAKYLIVQRRLNLNNSPSYKCLELPNEYYAKLFEYGGISQSGVLTNGVDRMRSIDFIDDNVKYIETANNNNSYSLWIRFYDANGDIDSSFGNTYNVNYVNFDELRALYPTYKFKVVLRLDQLGDTPFNNMYIKFKNTFVENKERTIYEGKNIYKNLMFYPYKFKKEAHRGLSNVYPQNTLKAFIGAGEQDFIYGIETDVQMTSDNVLVCFHDDTLDALTTGTGAVSSYTWENLQNVVYDNTPGSTTYPNETIPKFEDYLKVCRKYGKVPYIEIKNLDVNGIKYLVELVRKMGFVNRCVFTSFNLNHIKYLSYLAKNDFFIEYMVNNGTTIETAMSQAKPYNVNALRFNYYDITEDLVNTAHENNYLIDCWGLNVGNTSAYNNLIDCGAEGCTCDNWSWAN